MKKGTIFGLGFILCIVVVSIIYNTFPRLQLNGSNLMVLSYREEYVEPGVIIKNANTNYVSKVKIKNEIDNSKIGSYNVYYSLKIGGRTFKKSRTVKIIDNVKPVIKLYGEQVVTTQYNKDYVDLGYSAIDEYDGDITNNVVVNGNVDTKKLGEYVLNYNVHDSSNNSMDVFRIVKVVDDEAPIIKCDSGYFSAFVGSDFKHNCSAMDNYDGDLTNALRIEGKYDIQKSGVYKLELVVNDSSNNESRHEFYLVVYSSLNELNKLKDLYEIE